MQNFIAGSTTQAERTATSSLRADRSRPVSRRIPVKVPRQISNSGYDASNHWRNFVDLYLDGWAEANLEKVVAATANDYRFDDPLVGQFSRRSLPAYFAHLQTRFARAGTVGIRDFVFCFRGPVDASPCGGRREYFREAPRLGLTGVASIVIGESGIAAEHVTYDLNLASDVLRHVP
jgi:hypothetical protein